MMSPLNQTRTTAYHHYQQMVQMADKLTRDLSQIKLYTRQSVTKDLGRYVSRSDVRELGANS